MTCQATEIVLGRAMNALEIENDLLAARSLSKAISRTKPLNSWGRMTRLE